MVNDGSAHQPCTPKEPGLRPGSFAIVKRLTDAAASDEASSGRPAGTREVGELVWILPVARH
jgi:hypothetical protein